MTDRRKPSAVGDAGNVQQPQFELTAEEIAMAVRYFGVLRRIEQGMANETYETFLRAVGYIAEKYPRHAAPRLRLVSARST